MTIKDVTFTYIKKNFVYFILLIIFYMALAVITLLKPKGFPITELTVTYGQFGSSITAFVLLLFIGGFLIYRYYSKTKPLKSKPNYLLFWGISFLIFSLVFLGLCLEALDIEIADTSDSFLFILWYSPIIIWLAVFWIGISKMKRFEPALEYIPALAILIIGELWFFFGVFIMEDTFGTMYGLILLIVVPIIVIYSYYWYDFGKNSDLSSPYIISIGFLLLAVTFLAWTFWYFNDVKYIHYIWSNIFNISFTLIFAGFLVLPKETIIKF